MMATTVMIMHVICIQEIFALYYNFKSDKMMDNYNGLVSDIFAIIYFKKYGINSQNIYVL